MTNDIHTLLKEIKALEEVGQIEASIVKTKVAHELAQKTNDALLQGKVYRIISSQNRYNGEETEAISNINKAIELFKENKEELIEAINYKGKLLYESLYLKQAIETFEKQIELLKELGNQEEVIKSVELEMEKVDELQLMNFESFIDAILDLESKEKTPEIEEAIIEQYGCPRLEFLVRLYSKICIELLARGDGLAVVPLMKRGIEITKELHFEQVQVIFKNNLGLAYAKLGNLKKAMEVMDESLKACKALGSLVGEAMVLRNIANIKFEVKNNATKDEKLLNEILDDLKKSIEISKKLEDDLGIASAEKHLDEVTSALNRLKVQ